MPIYEYKCEKCGSVSEFLVGVTRDGTDLKCRSCGGAELKKILSRSNVSTGASDGPYECGGCDVGKRSCCPHGSCKH